MIERQRIGGVEQLRPAHGKVNAMDSELLGAITACFARLAECAPRPVVLTGAGSAFSAGLDLRRA